jgi:branched-chain amino acid transport system ATP-binding protein
VLIARQVDTFYRDFQALHHVSMRIAEGEIVSIVGSNGAGKTTLINTISGILHCASGEIAFLGKRIDRLPPYDIVALGVIQIPEGRQIFPEMSLLENLVLGAYTPRARTRARATRETVFQLLPILAERKEQVAGSLSGGEQQLLAIGRGLMSLPTLLMLDEPSLGLAPLMVKEVFRIVRRINAQGTTILLVEQNVSQSLALSHRGYVIENGRIVMEGKAQDLLQNENLQRSYLGI